jgi:hypothetical protein
MPVGVAIWLATSTHMNDWFMQSFSHQHVEPVWIIQEIATTVALWLRT